MSLSLSLASGLCHSQLLPPGPLLFPLFIPPPSSLSCLPLFHWSGKPATLGGKPPHWFPALASGVPPPTLPWLPWFSFHTQQPPPSGSTPFPPQAVCLVHPQPGPAVVFLPGGSAQAPRCHLHQLPEIAAGIPFADAPGCVPLAGALPWVLAAAVPPPLVLVLTTTPPLAPALGLPAAS